MIKTMIMIEVLQTISKNLKKNKKKDEYNTSAWKKIKNILNSNIYLLLFIY